MAWPGPSGGWARAFSLLGVPQLAMLRWPPLVGRCLHLHGLSLDCSGGEDRDLEDGALDGSWWIGGSDVKFVGGKQGRPGPGCLADGAAIQGRCQLSAPERGLFEQVLPLVGPELMPKILMGLLFGFKF